MRRRIAFVCPRYGAEIVGGAELLVREIALGLLDRGWEVQVLTTCAVNPYTWANELPESARVEEGILVRRFQNFLATSASKEHAVHGRIYYGERPSLDDQVTWLNALFRTPGLFEVLLRERDSFDAFVFAPYLFWSTTVCMPVVADRAVVMPCLHDEVYAHLEVMRHVLSIPASVWFLSGPEHDLAHRMGPVTPQNTIIGAGMDVPESYDPEEFREEYGIDSPFVLYLGRREADKGWPWLVDVFGRTRTPVKLVSAGAGDAAVPPRLRGRIIDVGLLSTEQRNNALAAALAYVQPSLMESYSRTVMESWLAGTPVLARKGSAVVEWHCARSGGGSNFSGSRDLTKSVANLLASPDLATEMGERGRSYVLDNYQWPHVLDLIEADLELLKGGR
ncbi:MAG TPA: glycosyltransferase family 4 protein [Acidimicrobiales bacterium]|nr:glycosyltransferase family 4 protein [Acidimicrobiales bacterium]